MLPRTALLSLILASALVGAAEPPRELDCVAVRDGPYCSEDLCTLGSRILNNSNIKLRLDLVARKADLNGIAGYWDEDGAHRTVRWTLGFLAPNALTIDIHEGRWYAQLHGARSVTFACKARVAPRQTQ